MLAQHPHATIINDVIGRPYLLGAQGPESFDCYGLVRHLQRECADRDLPVFEMPGDAGRHAIAAMIATHPERARWQEVEKPIDLCVVTMAKADMPYHMGVWFDLDGGLIVHCHGNVEEPGDPSGPGVVSDSLAELRVGGWRRFRFYIPK